MPIFYPYYFLFNPFSIAIVATILLSAVLNWVLKKFFSRFISIALSGIIAFSLFYIYSVITLGIGDPGLYLFILLTGSEYPLGYSFSVLLALLLPIIIYFFLYFRSFRIQPLEQPVPFWKRDFFLSWLVIILLFSFATGFSFASNILAESGNCSLVFRCPSRTTAKYKKRKREKRLQALVKNRKLALCAASVPYLLLKPKEMRHFVQDYPLEMIYSKQ